MKRNVISGGLVLILFLGIYAAASFAVAYIVYQEGLYPQGSDTMYHVFRGDVLYHSILSGDWYPLYNRYWYNGVELMRYWAPLSPFVFALGEAVLPMGIMGGYYAYIAVILFFGGLSWLYIGFRKGRPFLGGIIGLLWFFMPNNLYALFGEGNLPRSLSMVLLPLLFYHIAEFMATRDFRHTKWIILWQSLILLCHVGYGGMVALSVLLFLLLDKLINRRKRAAMAVIFAMVLPFALIGLYLYPSLRGISGSVNNAEIMKGFFQSAAISLNPLHRLSTGETFYFGLAAFLLAVFGIICSQRKSMSLFWTGILIFFGTTNLAYPLLSRVPGSSYLWMLRFISIALCLILYGFLIWDRLRTGFVVLVLLLLCVDVIPSISLFYRGQQKNETAEEQMSEEADRILLSEAKEITTQRMALLDGGSTGAMPHFYLAGMGPKRVEGSFGAGIQAAVTSKNVVMLNEAVESGAYLYLFDRLLELGNDTALIKINEMKEKGADFYELSNCAERVGFRLVDQTDEYLLCHYDTECENFGTITKYKSIGIGTSSTMMQLYYPVMEEGKSDNIEDYTFEELKDYEVIYLDHFEYNDLATAEALVKKLADAGVRIVISADGIPVNVISKVQEFLGVNCSRVLFENGYPFLYYNDTKLDLNFFAEGYENWETVFLNRLDHVKGYFFDNNLQEAFYGTVYNDNIEILSLNLIYHYMLTEDPFARMIMDDAMQLNPAELPERSIVPISVRHSHNEITIDSGLDGVNTTIAYHDNFESDREIRRVNNLLTVNKGVTTITMSYPYLKQGMALTLVGLVLTILYLAVGRLSFERELEKERLIREKQLKREEEEKRQKDAYVEKPEMIG